MPVIREFEVVRKFTAIQLKTEKINAEVNVKLTYGEITGPHYYLEYPEEEFDSEDDAILYAQEKNPYAKWIIVPTIEFRK